MMEEKRELQEVNITDLWNKNLFESIQKLQDFERICRDGAVSIVEYLQIPPERMTNIQFQYLRMMVSEMGILLANARARLGREFYIRSRLQLKQIKEKLDLDSGDIFVSSYNQQNHTTQFYLSELYYKYLHLVTTMREGIITELQDILFGIGNKKAEGMEKMTEVLRK